MVQLNATVDHRYQPQLQHDEGRIIYENMGMMEKALKNQVIESTKDTYLKEFKKNTPASLESCVTISLSICSMNTEKARLHTSKPTISE